MSGQDTLQIGSLIRDSPEVRKTERLIIVGYDETGRPLVKTPQQLEEDQS